VVLNPVLNDAHPVDTSRTPADADDEPPPTRIERRAMTPGMIARRSRRAPSPVRPAKPQPPALRPPRPSVPQWSVRVTAPDDWMAVDVAADPAARWATLAPQVDELLWRRPELAVARSWVEHVAHDVAVDPVVEGALGMLVGFAALPDGFAAMSAGLWDMPGLDKTAGGVEPGELARRLAAPQPDDLTEREVTVVGLPCGDAVRVHTITEAPTEPRSEVEGVDHLVPVPGTGDVLLLSCTTPTVALGDVLLPLFDSIAWSIEITR